MNMKALLVIDMLNDFVNEDGALPVPDARTLVPSINREIKQCREEASPIIFVCDAHDKEDREFKAWPKHAVDGTEGAKIIYELDRRDSDIIIKKKRYSAFYDTRLETYPRREEGEYPGAHRGPNRHLRDAHCIRRSDEKLPGNSS